MIRPKDDRSASKNMTVKEFASLGGKARWKGKTKKERTAYGKMMSEAAQKAREKK